MRCPAQTVQDYYELIWGASVDNEATVGRL